MYGVFFIISINKESKVSYSATIRIESLKLVTLKPKVPLIISYVQYTAMRVILSILIQNSTFKLNIDKTEPTCNYV